MQLNFPFTAAAALAFAAAGCVQAGDELDKAEIYLEQNATDGDAEVVIKTNSGDEGLSALTVVAPDGRTLVDFKSPDSKLGLRSFSLESPEPENDGRVQADFPPGEYGFTGTTVEGEQVSGSATLSHTLPPAVSFLNPKDEQEDVPSTGLKVQWTPLEGMKKYVVILEDEEADLELEVELPGSASSFEVPNGYIGPDTEYEIAIGSVAPDGNRSFVEISFETAEAK